MGRLKPWTMYGSCLLLVVIYVGALSALAFHVSDYHMMNRGGALLAAVGALAVIWQVLVEERFEISNEIDRAASRNELSPENQEAARRITQARAAGRRTDRMRIVICIAFLVMMGELLHGWGDVIAEAVCPIQSEAGHAPPASPRDGVAPVPVTAHGTDR